MWICVCLSVSSSCMCLELCVSSPFLFPLCLCASSCSHQPCVCSFGLSRPSPHISIHHSLRAHPRASSSPLAPFALPAEALSLAPPQARHRGPRGHGRSVMDGSVGGRRLEERHTHTCSQTHTMQIQGHTKSSRGSVPPAAVKEREEEIGKRRGVLIGITKALLMKGSVCVCVCV